MFGMGQNRSLSSSGLKAHHAACWGPVLSLSGALPVPSMMSAGWSTSYEQGSLGIGTGSISDRAGRDSWLELRDCPFSRESSSFDMESSPSVGVRRRLQS